MRIRGLAFRLALESPLLRQIFDDPIKALGMNPDDSI